MRREIHLFPDWGNPWSLWDPHNLKDLSAGDLGLSGGLAKRLARWYDRWYRDFDPARGWSDASEGREWLAEGLRIAADLATELTSVTIVPHFCHAALGAAEESFTVNVRPEDRFHLRSVATGAPPIREIRLFPEWCNDWPLWEVGADSGPAASPEQSGLSPGLVKRLQTWNDIWLEHFDDQTGWDDDHRGRSWMVDGYRLAADLRVELGDGFKVFDDYLGDAPPS